MVHREIIYLLIWWFLSFSLCFPAEKLSPDQQKSVPSPYRLTTPVPPFESGPSTTASPAVSTNVINKDDVQYTDIKCTYIDGVELYHKIDGPYSYTSPEGIHVIVYYNVDKNGYYGGFKLGVCVEPSIAVSLAVPGSIRMG